MQRSKSKRKVSELVNEIEKVYLLFFWIILISLLVYWVFHEDYPLALQVAVNSFNFFILPYLIGFVYIFRSLLSVCSKCFNGDFWIRLQLVIC